MDITIIRNRSQKGVKVEQILIGSERVGRVQGGHHNNPLPKKGVKVEQILIGGLM
jgi:DNA-binding protein